MGQATPLVALVFAVVAGSILLLAQLGAIATDRAHARTAADAAALAGAAEGEPAARSVAFANQAQLESFVQLGEDVEVTVRVDEARATARARRRWVSNQLGASRGVQGWRPRTSGLRRAVSASAAGPQPHRSRRLLHASGASVASASPQVPR